MNELQSILADTVTRLYTDRVTQELRESAEKGVWPTALWQQVEENGLTLPQIPEARGGAGGTWEDAHIVVAAAGRFAVPLPLPETMVGAWLLAEAGLDVPNGPLTVAPVQPTEHLALTAGRHLSGTATRVPWGRARSMSWSSPTGRLRSSRGERGGRTDVNLALELATRPLGPGARHAAASAPRWLPTPFAGTGPSSGPPRWPGGSNTSSRRRCST
jgi:hypothetical protein